MFRVVSHSHVGNGSPVETVVLAHDERHLRRKVLSLASGMQIMLDFPEPVSLSDGDFLILEDGRQVRVIAAEEELYAVTPRDRLHLCELAWHLGNRHLPAQIEEARIVIQRDRIIRSMLEGLGASVAEISGPFHPMRGAYHGEHSHSHSNRSEDHHEH